MADPITADQLEKRVEGAKAVAYANGWYDSATEIRLTYNQWAHLVQCAREHEERAAEPTCALCGDSGWIWSENRAGKIYAGKQCVCAKAAVEKAVQI